MKHILFCCFFLSLNLLPILAQKQWLAVDVNDGKLHSVFNMQAKKKLVIFWSVFCGPCHQALQRIEAIQAKQNPKKRWNIVTISLDQSMQKVKTTVTRLRVGLPTFIDGESGLSHFYRVTNTPTILILDTHDRVLLRQEGFSDEILANIETKMASQ